MQNPWRCLAAYKEPQNGDKETYKFCGRDKETYELASLIRNNLHVTLYGRTGIGKTSLLEAGVFPQLRREDYVPVVIRFGFMTDGKKTFAELIVQSIETQGLTIEKTVEEGIGLPVIADEPNVEYLWEYFATRHFYDGERKVFPMIVLDQFEENLISNRSKSEALLKQIYALMDDNKEFPVGYHSETNFRFVISIREDELFRLEECIDRSHLSDFKKNRYRLAHLSKQEAEDVICIPGGSLLPDDEGEKRTIIDRILNQATDGDNDDINTLLLSLVCSCMYERCIVRNTEKFTISDVNVLGDNLLIDFYQSLHIKKKIREVIENKFIDTKGRRNAVNVGDLDIPQSELDELCIGNKRILQKVNKRMELVHDLLAHAIFETKQKRQRKSLGRIFKVGLLVLLFMVLVVGLLGSVFSFSDSDAETLERISIFPKKELLVSRGDTCHVQYNHNIETVIYEGGNSYTAFIKNCKNLKRVVLQGAVSSIYIHDCPSLCYLVFADSSKVKCIDLSNCPNLNYLNIPDGVSSIHSNNPIRVIPKSNSTKYVALDDVVWDVENARILYANLDHHSEDSLFVVFPNQLRHEKIMQYKQRYCRNVFFVNKGEVAENGFVIDSEFSYRPFVVGSVKTERHIDLSGVAVGVDAFNNSDSLECITIDSETHFNSCYSKSEDYERVFCNCPNFGQVNIHQSEDFALSSIIQLLCVTKAHSHPLNYEISGEGPLRKTKDGVILYNDIPVLISGESDKKIELKEQGDSIYVCAKGWYAKITGNGQHLTILQAYGQPHIATFPDTILIDNLILAQRSADYIVVGQQFQYLEDSFIEGAVGRKYVYCGNLTKKARTFYVRSKKTKFVNLPDSIRSEIRLLVPYGQLDDYLYYRGNGHDRTFSGFGDISELSLLQTMWGSVVVALDGVLFFFEHHTFALLLFVLGLAFILVWLWYLAYIRLKQQEPSFILIRTFTSALSITALTLFTWISVYWFLWFWLFSTTFDNIAPSIIATIIALVVTLLIYKNILYQIRNVTLKDIKSDMHFLFMKYRKGGYCSIIGIILLIIGLLWLKDYWNRIDRATNLYKVVRCEVNESSDANKTALYVLTNSLQKEDVPSTSIKDSIYALLDDLSYEEGYNIERLDSCAESVHSISLSSDGNLLLLGCDDGLVQVWNMQERKLVNTVDCHDWCYIRNCGWIDNKRFIAFTNYTLYCCNITDSIPVSSKDVDASIKFQKILGTQLFYAHNGDATLNVMDIKGNQLVETETLPLFESSIQDLCRYKDGLLVCDEHIVKEYNPKTRMLVKLYESFQEIKDICANGGDNSITVMTADSIHQIDIFDEKTRIIRSAHPKQIEGFIPTHSDLKLGCEYGPSYGNDMLFEISKPVNGQAYLIRKFIAKGVSGRDVVVSEDDKCVYTIGKRRELCIVHLDKPKREKLLRIISENFAKDKYKLSDEEKYKYGIRE